MMCYTRMWEGLSYQVEVCPNPMFIIDSFVEANIVLTEEEYFLAELKVGKHLTNPKDIIE